MGRRPEQELPFLLNDKLLFKILEFIAQWLHVKDILLHEVQLFIVSINDF